METIAGHTIDKVTRNAVKIGCQTVTRKQAAEFMQMMDEAVDEDEFPDCSDLETQDTSEAIGRVRQKTDRAFMQIRGFGEYTLKGFVLGRDGDATMINWKIVKDSEGMNCLIPENDEIKVEK